jgi:outer membrane protein TolC
MFKYKTILILLVFIAGASAAFSAENPGRILDLDEFIRLACEKDQTFEAILMDELTAQYQARLNLPAESLVLSVKGEYNLSLKTGEDDEPQGSVALSKLFPSLGTSVGVEGAFSKNNTLNTSCSEFAFTITQPIAKNAFGYTNRLLEKISGLELDIARHQVVEAYEDYLAQLIKTYYNWYAAFAHVQTERATCRENRKLLEDIRARQKSKIAHRTDVNKVHLKVLEKEATLLELEAVYENLSSVIKQAIQDINVPRLTPKKPVFFQQQEINFKRAYRHFTETSRTYQILDLIEEKAGKEVSKCANQLLPSADLLLGCIAEGSEQALDSRKNEVYAGISVEIPFMVKPETWQHELAKADLRKNQLTAGNKKRQLCTELENLQTEIQTTQKRLGIAGKKVELAQMVLKDETRYYRQGRTKLNDLILAADNLEENRYKKIYLAMHYYILMNEWLRMTDRLIDRSEIRKKKSAVYP